MKIITVFLMTILVGSCRQTIDSYQSGNSDRTIKRNDRLSKAMDDYSKTGNPYYMRHEFVFRGPLTVAQVKYELIESYNESSTTRLEIYDFTEKFEDSETGEGWDRIKSKYREGDELYFYIAIAKPSWSQYEGYVLIRENNVVADIVTSMNY